MTFNWVAFVRQYHIDFVESGPSVVRGHIAVRCPFCGSGDQSHHMGLCVEGDKRGFWGCWRNSSHRGKSPVKLIQALTGVSYAEACRIAGKPAAPELGSDATMGAEMAALLGDKKEDEQKPSLTFPKQFRPVENVGYGRMFIKYLRDERDYTTPEAEHLCKRYDLRFCTTGPFAYRLVMPVNMPDMGLVGWTGRSIDKDEKLRYKSLSEKAETAEREGLPQAPVNIKDCLFNCEKLARVRADVLVAVEGPMDALRLDYFGRDVGVRSTCLFSKSLSQSQEEFLGVLADRYTHKLVLVDADAQTDAFGLYTKLERFGFKYRLLSTGDPAEMTAKQIRRLNPLA